MKHAIITADDFGLDHEINRGIIEAHSKGIVTATAVLMNAPCTNEAIEIAKDHKTLEYGLHLSFVEGRSLAKTCKTICDDEDYFSPGPCLIMDWKKFVGRYATLRISLKELEQELRLQFECFVREFGPGGFLNGTQHLHLLPFIQDLILRLAVEYGFKGIRIPKTLIASNAKTEPKQRGLSSKMMLALGQLMAIKAKARGLFFTDAFAGFDASGQMDESKLERIFERMKSGVTEIMCHPGFESSFLRKNLGKSYQDFDWLKELNGLKHQRVKDQIRSQEIHLTTFKACFKND